MDRERLIELLQGMLEADLPQTRRIIEGAYEQLCEPGVDDMLAAIAAETADEGLREAVAWHADLIRECRDLGVDAGVGAVQARQTARALDASAMEMAKTPRWQEMRATAEAYPEILTDAFDRHLRMMIDNIQAHREFIEDHRTHGAVEASRLYGVEKPHVRVNLDMLPALAGQIMEALEAEEAQDSISSERKAALIRLLLGEVGPGEHPEFWGAMQDRLGNLLRQLADQGSTIAHLDDAIAAFDLALTVRTELGMPGSFASTQNNRGIALQAKADASKDFGLYKLVFAAFEAAIRVWTPEAYPYDHAIALNNLADAWRAYGDQTGDARAYFNALEMLETAERYCTRRKFAAAWAMIQRNIGVTNFRLAERGLGNDALANAIDRLRQAIATLELVDDAPLLVTSWHDLGNALRLQGERRADADILREAVALLRQVADVRWQAKELNLHAATQADLGAALFKLGEVEPGATYLVEAILTCRLAAARQAALSGTDQELATRNTLGAALRSLAFRETSPEAARDAVEILEAVRMAAIAGGTQALLISATNNLLASLILLADLAQQPNRLEDAIVLAEEFVSDDLRHRSPGEWATIISHLAEAQCALGRIRADTCLLAAAATNYRRSLEERTEDRWQVGWAATQNNLGTALRLRGEAEADQQLLEQAVDAYRAALRHLDPNKIPLEWARATKNLGSTYSRLGRFDDAVALFDGVMARLVPVIGSAKSIEEEHAFLLEAAGIADETGFALIRLGRNADALAAVERGRSILLNQTSGRGSSDPALAAREHWRSSSEAARRQTGIVLGMSEAELLRETGPVEAHAALHALADTAHAVLRELTRDEVDTRLQLEDMINTAGPPGGAIVVLVVANAGAAAICLTGGTDRTMCASVVELPGVTADTVNALLIDPAFPGAGWLHRYAKLYGDIDDVGSAQALAQWNAFVGPFLERLWDLVMGPVDTQLQSAGVVAGSEITLIAPGRLSILPLAAARVRENGGWRHFVEKWATSLAPSIGTAAKARRKIASHDSRTARLLAVTDPLGDLGMAENPAWGFFAPDARLRLDGLAATTEAVMRNLPEYSHLSFYGHGEWDAEDPENSALIMAGADRLSIRQLRMLDMQSSRLAILGACETGVIGVHQLPDEFIGLPAAMAKAGVPAIVSTLWPVDAANTDRLIRSFLAAHLGGESPARALRRAQLTALAGDAGGTVDRIVLQGAGSQPTDGPALMRSSEPAMWAAFTVTGV